MFIDARVARTHTHTQVFNEMDLDDDRTVSFEEFVHYIRERKLKSTEAEATSKAQTRAVPMSDAAVSPMTPPQPAPSTLPTAMEKPGAASVWLVGAVRSGAAAGTLRRQQGLHAGLAACHARRSEGPESAKSAPNGAANGSVGSRRRLRTHVSAGQQHGVRSATITKRSPLQVTVAVTVPGVARVLTTRAARGRGGEWEPLKLSAT